MECYIKPYSFGKRGHNEQGIIFIDIYKNLVTAGMKKYIYTKEQFDQILNLLNNVTLNGVNNITTMAVIIQILGNAETNDEPQGGV